MLCAHVDLLARGQGAEVSLIDLSLAYESMRERMHLMRYRLTKAEGELDEIKMFLHQFSVGNDFNKERARSFLLAIVRERQTLIDQRSREKEEGQKRGMG